MAKELKKYLFLTPAIVITILFFLVPVILLSMVSITDRSSFFFTPIYTLDNYYDTFTHYSFDLKNTLTLSACAATLDILFGYPFAYFMIRKIRRFTEIFRSILLIPLFGELYIAFGLWYLFLPHGPLGFLFEALGIQVFEALYSMPAAILALAIYTFPFAVLQIGTSLSEVDPVLEEAAMCLGASPLRSLFQVTIPLSMPGILSGWFMSFGWSIGAYVIPVLMGGVIIGQRVVSVKIRAIALLMMNYGLAASLAVGIMLIAIIASFLSLKVSKGALI